MGELIEQRGGKMAITRRFRRLKMAELFGHKLKKATLWKINLKEIA